MPAGAASCGGCVRPPLVLPRAVALPPSTRQSRFRLLLFAFSPFRAFAIKSLPFDVRANVDRRAVEAV